LHIVLEIQDLQKTFVEPDGTPCPVLNVPKFALGAGEQSVLLGQSGCGKTTFLNVIAGITTPDHGMVRVDGQDVTRLHEGARDRFRAQKIGYVFQTFNLLSGFTALENVLLGQSFTQGRSDGGWARELLGRVGLGHRLTHKPAALSVGEQQRVAVARALANRPRLLLADEPTANVDAKHQQGIVELIRDTCREHKVALLLVTHAPAVAEQFDRVERLESFNLAAGTA
jgi:putative ABC transport system ATP-binding protein